MSFVGGCDCWKDHSTCCTNKEQKANLFLHRQCRKKKLNYPFDWMVLKHTSHWMLIHMGTQWPSLAPIRSLIDNRFHFSIVVGYWLNPMPHRNCRRGSKGLMLGHMTWKHMKKYCNFGPLKCSFLLGGKTTRRQNESYHLQSSWSQLMVRAVRDVNSLW